MTTTTIQTFTITNHPRAIESAVAQCVAAMIDLGCGSKVKTNKKTIRVTSDHPLHNNQTGETSRISFLIKLR